MGREAGGRGARGADRPPPQGGPESEAGCEALLFWVPATPGTQGCSPAWSPAPGLTTLLTSLPDPEDSQLLMPTEAPDPGQRSVPALSVRAGRPRER